MNSTTADVIKVSPLSVGPHPSYNLSDDDIVKLMDGTKANIVMLIFIVIWLIKLLVKTFLRFRKAVNRHSEAHSHAMMERGGEEHY